MKDQEEIQQIEELIDEVIESWNKWFEEKQMEGLVGWSPGLQNRFEAMERKERKRQETLGKQDQDWTQRARSLTLPEKGARELLRRWLEAAECAGEIGASMAMSVMVERLGSRAPMSKAWSWAIQACKNADTRSEKGVARLARWIQEQEPEKARKRDGEMMEWALFKNLSEVVDAMEPWLDETSAMWVSRGTLSAFGVEGQPELGKRQGGKGGGSEVLLEGGFIIEMAEEYPKKLTEWILKGKIKMSRLAPWQWKGLSQKEGLVAAMEKAELSAIEVESPKETGASGRSPTRMRL